MRRGRRVPRRRALFLVLVVGRVANPWSQLFFARSGPRQQLANQKAVGNEGRYELSPHILCDRFHNVSAAQRRRNDNRTLALHQRNVVSKEKLHKRNLPSLYRNL